MPDTAEVISPPNDKIPRIRSQAYPTYTITECIEIVKRIYQNFGNSGFYTREQIAKVLKISVGHILTQLSSCTYYGLLTMKSKLGYKPSDLFLKIYKPIDDKEKVEALALSIHTPEIYNHLFEEFKDCPFPSPAALATILFRKYGIAEKVSDAAAGIILDNLNALNFLDEESGLLKFNVVDASVQELYSNNQIVSKANLNDVNPVNSVNIDKASFIVKQSILNETEGNYRDFSITLKSGEEVRISYPKYITEHDWDKVIRVITAMKE
jgi:hypothetical protein